MKLHEAIVEILTTANRSMTTQQLADELNRTGLYEKKDGSEITAFQVHGRTKKYPQLFDRNGTVVNLEGKKSDSKFTDKLPVPQVIVEKTTTNQTFANNEVEKRLMKDDQFLSARIIDMKVPRVPGMYAIRIKNPDALPEPFKSEMLRRGNRLIYIGIATTSLHQRMLNQELRANGHGTFFRSLGAMLGYVPPYNSLNDKKNKRNYTFSSEDENRIIDWINEYLLVSWIEQSNSLEEVETGLIIKHKPLLNVAKNPYAMEALSALRKRCVEVANGRI